MGTLATPDSLSRRRLDKAIKEGSVRLWLAFRLREHREEAMALQVPAAPRGPGHFDSWPQASNDADYLAPFITETET